MSCAGCAAQVEKVIARQPGVQEATVNFAAATVTLTYDPLLTSEQALRTKVQEAGYDLILETETEKEETEKNRATNV